MFPFFDLPAELRDMVYYHFLDDVVAPQSLLPWQLVPVQSNLQAYRALLLCSRQVEDELQSIFDNEYAHRLILYTDDVGELQTMQRRCKQSTTLKDMRFNIRMKREGVKKDATKTQYLDRLIERQPGFDPWWTDEVGFYRAQPTGDGDWIPEQHGFRGHHYKKSASEWQEHRYLAFRRLQYPILENDCQITAYSWLSPKGRLGGTMELEGRLRDLVMDSRSGPGDHETPQDPYQRGTVGSLRPMMNALRALVV